MAPKYTSTEELQKQVDKYFKQTHEKITITGLTLFLGFCDRRSFYNYGDNPKFSHTIKKAHCRIEQYYEDNLHGKNVIGSIFALKNLGWSDNIKQDIQVHQEQPLYPALSSNGKVKKELLSEN